MKFRKLLGGGLLAAVLALGGVAGLATRSESKSVKADETTYYYRGTKTGWAGEDDYSAVNNGNALIMQFDAGDQFKFTPSKTEWGGAINSATGDAVSCGCFTFNYGDDNNIYVNTTGKYAISFVNDALYLDFGTLYYSGSENEWGITPDSKHPAIDVNGDSVTFDLVAGEKFKIRNSSWDYGCFGFSNLKDGDFYGTFYGEDNGNIVCNFAGTYTAKITLGVRGAWTIRVTPSSVDPDSRAKVYVLDKYGTNLNTNHNIHVFNAAGQETKWPGAVMSIYEGTTHMYEFEYWTGMETAIFNNKVGDSGTQSWDHALSFATGKCLILDGHTDSYGKWDSNTWVSPEVAKYIENCMHFANYSESEEGDGKCVSEGWYITARDAYQESSFAPFRAELCTLDYVVARLQAWAAANSATFTPEGGFVPAQRTISLFGTMDNSTPIMLVVIISVVSLTAVGGYIFLKRRKED